MKKDIGTVDATPSKRTFSSIIADYDLNRGISELIDNSLDIWTKQGRKNNVKIQISIDMDQQSIQIEDNAGGVKEDELYLLVGPGQTSNKSSEEIIGLFGVGTKRAVVALAQSIQITTRFKKEKTCQIEFGDEWSLKNEEWILTKYEVDPISDGTTIIHLNKLRFSITPQMYEFLKEHLQATYAKFLTNKKLVIELNGHPLIPITFENWAYPPKYPPYRYVGSLETNDNKKVDVEVIAGLSNQSSPAEGEYGVYVYCNDRLIARALHDHTVGFTKGIAGYPHPSISLTKIIVSLKGESQLMPWNSSKSAINPNHRVFVALWSWLVQVIKDFSSLSRRLAGDWNDEVFNYTTGEIKEIKISNFPTAKKSYLPELPKSKQKYEDKIEKANSEIADAKPWARGLFEGVIAVDKIFNLKKINQKNRICLILLDSNLEIAFKEYLVNECGQTYNDARLLALFNNRRDVHTEIKKYIKKIKKDNWKKIEYYYRMRCDLIHKRTTTAISDQDIDQFREIVEDALKKMFKIDFGV